MDLLKDLDVAVKCVVALLFALGSSMVVVASYIPVEYNAFLLIAGAIMTTSSFALIAGYQSLINNYNAKSIELLTEKTNELEEESDALSEDVVELEETIEEIEKDVDELEKGLDIVGKELDELKVDEAEP